MEKSELVTFRLYDGGVVDAIVTGCYDEDTLTTFRTQYDRVVVEVSLKKRPKAYSKLPVKLPIVSEQDRWQWRSVRSEELKCESVPPNIAGGTPDFYDPFTARDRKGKPSQF